MFIGVPLVAQSCDILHFVDRHEFEIPSFHVKYTLVMITGVILLQ